MTENPYNSPGSEVESDSESQRPGSLWKGILFGGLLDLGGSIAAGTIMLIIYMLQVWSPEMTPEYLEQVANQYTKEITSFSNIWSFISLFFGLGFSVLGGYVCAFFAREKWQKAVLILAAILSGYALLVGGEHYQLGVLLVLTLLSVISIYIGGWLRAGRRY